ncbi:MAG: sigma-70 family RNA polymerase sigma factor [Candidatus Methylacidiphilales bacterium]|nr:sigma-70 family RNA polymerase sigma factor [Candidatus Methylacidiphilales bacterium]
MSDLPDEDLMRATAAGDDGAFAALVRRHQDRVYGTVYKMLGAHQSEAEDVAQQVFIRVHRAAARYRPEAKFTTWLMTICRNCVFTQLKKSRRHPSVPLDPVGPDGEEIESPLPDPEARSADQMLQEKEMRRTLETAMAELPELQRSALVLRQYEQLDYEEIARVLQTTVPAVKSLLFRARDMLRQRLQDYLRET